MMTSWGGGAPARGGGGGGGGGRGGGAGAAWAGRVVGAEDGVFVVGGGAGADCGGDVGQWAQGGDAQGWRGREERRDVGAAYYWAAITGTFSERSIVVVCAGFAGVAGDARDRGYFDVRSQQCGDCERVVD